jgi:hypothetical protein
MRPLSQHVRLLGDSHQPGDTVLDQQRVADVLEDGTAASGWVDSTSLRSRPMVSIRSPSSSARAEIPVLDRLGASFIGHAVAAMRRSRLTAPALCRRRIVLA